MGNATGVSDLHVDKVLSQMAIGYMTDAGIADRIAPTVRVDKQTDRYDVYSRADALRIEDTRRAPDSEARKVTRSVSSGNYYAENYALKYPVTLEDKRNMDPNRIRHLYNGRVQYIANKLNLDWEKRVADQVTNTSNVGSSSAIASAWNGAGDVIGDIETAMDNVQDTTGARANRMVIGLDAWRSLRRDSTLRNLILGNNNGGGYPNTAQIAAFFELDEILVGGAYHNSAGEGSETLAKVWGDHALLYYAPAAASVEFPSFMYSYRWVGGGLPEMTVERHPFDTRRKSEEVEMGYYQDEVITGAEYGFLLVAVNSST